MVCVLNNSIIKGNYEYYITEDDRIFRRKITLEEGYDRFRQINTYEVERIINGK